MDIRKFEIKDNSFVEVKSSGNEFDMNSESLLIYDVKTKERKAVSELFHENGISEKIINKIIEPEEHQRFDYIDEYGYGEIPYFSKKLRSNTYIAVVSYKNVLILISDVYEGIVDDLINSYPSFIKEFKKKVDIEFLVFIMIHELLARTGSLILLFRKEVETLAFEFEKKNIKATPEDIFDLKNYTSTISRSLEMLFYTLAFPPVIDVVDKKSKYNIYFKELLEPLGLLKISLSLTEERLNSIHDHFDLLLQEKSNKRLKFLTIIQAVFVPLTLLAGIYGMNFKYMPELDYKYSYFFALSAMFLIGILILIYFKRRGWFN